MIKLVDIIFQQHDIFKLLYKNKNLYCIIKMFRHKFDWEVISGQYGCHHCDLDPDIPDENGAYCCSLPDDFMITFSDDINWYSLLHHRHLLENSIRKCNAKWDEVIWSYISKTQDLSEEFIEEFQDNVDWECISEYQILTEEFIEKFRIKVDWYKIRKYQTLTSDFIEKFDESIDWSDMTYASSESSLSD